MGLGETAIGYLFVDRCSSQAGQFGDFIPADDPTFLKLRVHAASLRLLSLQEILLGLTAKWMHNKWVPDRGLSNLAEGSAGQEPHSKWAPIRGLSYLPEVMYRFCLHPWLCCFRRVPSASTNSSQFVLGVDAVEGVEGNLNCLSGGAE